MIELSINNLMKFYGANKIFENITFDIKTGERVGLIGKNGCGKTTLMKIIMGRYLDNTQPGSQDTEGANRVNGLPFLQENTEDSQGGEINLRKGCKVGYLNQIPIYNENTKSLDVIRMAFSNVFEIKSKMNELEYQLGSLDGDTLERAVRSYGRLSEQYKLEGGYELETKINKITEGLKITDSLKGMFFSQLSGGEKTRVILAKILLEEPDILLLDEPTNHLDLETVEWLEGFLKNYKGSVLIISHDRYFLDSVTGKIVELKVDRADIYMGNYSYYVLEKERRFLIEYKNYINQQKKIEQMEKQIERYRIWGEMRDSDKMFKRAKELEKRLEKIEKLDKPVLNSRRIRFNQDNADRSGKIVVKTEDISKSYENVSLLKDINLPVFYQDSACIIGKNGCGKTTLLKMILGEIKPDSGYIKIGSQVKIGYLPQQVVFEDEELTILEYFADFHNITYETARNQLARVLFMKEDVNKKIKILSGGEKSRLKLCSLTFEKVNFMILDEPTNHLDIDSREVLEETLTEFEGTLLFVSHDRYFINKVADKIITIRDGNLKIYQGDYNYYLEEIQKESESKALPESEYNRNRDIKKGKEDNSLKDNGKGSREKNNAGLFQHENNFGHQGKNINKQQEKEILRDKVKKVSERKIEILEKEIDEMETELKYLEEEMNKFNSDVVYLRELYLKKETTEHKLKLAYDNWESCQL